MIKLPDNKNVRSLASLALVSLIGTVLVILIMKQGLPTYENRNRFLEPLMPMIFGGTALTLVGSFLFGVVALANEKDAPSRKWIILGIILVLLLGYTTSYVMFNTLD